MLAQRLPGLLPPLTRAEALEVAAIAAVSGHGFDARQFGLRPFRAPHHTASAHAIIGGGARAQPGEVSLAHHGVLFLDELPEFDRRVLEALREPLEAGEVCISRVKTQAHYPARFQLVAAMNPCPCGWWGDPAGRCVCPPARLARYRQRLSGPLLERIDLRITVAAVTPEELIAPAAREPGPAADAQDSATLAARVGAARRLQLARAGKLNAHLEVQEVERDCRLQAGAHRLLELSISRLSMSARAVHRVLRVARTIADLADCGPIESGQLAEAVQLRRELEAPAPPSLRDYFTSPTR
jgi:magnesium chelatase family protein